MKKVIIVRKKLTAIILLFTVAVMPLRAYQVVLNSGDKNILNELLDKSQWSYVADNMDKEMFIGPWGRDWEITQAQRATIMSHSTTDTTIVEEPYKISGDLNDWVTSRTLPPNVEKTFGAGGTVQWVSLYHAGGVSWITSSQLNNAKNIFDENGRPASWRSWSTIVRTWDSSYPQRMEPFNGFLFEVRINEYNNDINGLHDAVNAATQWGLDNGKSVFLQFLPPFGPNPQYVTEYKQAVKNLRSAIGVTRMQYGSLHMVFASYGSEYMNNTPETNPRNLILSNQSAVTGAARTLLIQRYNIERGLNGW